MCACACAREREREYPSWESKQRGNYFWKNWKAEKCWYDLCCSWLAQLPLLSLPVSQTPGNKRPPSLSLNLSRSLSCLCPWREIEKEIECMYVFSNVNSLTLRFRSSQCKIYRFRFRCRYLDNWIELNRIVYCNIRWGRLLSRTGTVQVSVNYFQRGGTGDRRPLWI